MEKLIDDESYIEKIILMLRKIEMQENQSMDLAAEAAYRSIRDGGLLHVFSTGHSHMIVEEMFFRAGGLLPINPILSNDLMLHEGALTSTKLERTPGKAKEVMELAGLKKGDTIIISSNSGINMVPLEAAMFAKSKGLTVICVTSKRVSEELESRHPNNKKLYELSDIVIDNYAPFGDCLLTIPKSEQLTGGASTFGSLFIAQRIVLKIENLFLKDGLAPPVFVSANIPGGDEYIEEFVKPYKNRIKALS